MQLRRFLGESTPAALGQVREALGSEAIILANRRIGDRVEIIATGHIDEEAVAAARAMEAGNDAAIGHVRSDADEKATEEVHLEHTKSESSGLPESVVEPSPPPIDLSEVPGIESLESAPLADDSQTAGFEALNEIASLSEDLDSTTVAEQPVQLKRRSADNSDVDATGSKARVDTRSEAAGDTAAHTLQGGADSLDHQLNAALAEMLERHQAFIESRIRNLEIKLWSEIEPVRSRHLKHLVRLGLGAELAVRLAERIPADIDHDAALRKSLSVLKSTLPIGCDSTFSEPGVTVLSGPTGSGKSTVLMKMAAQHLRSHSRESLVLIATDTRRIGAFESLQAFGRLLGVPAVHARSDDELRGLIAAFAHKTLVLIDHTQSSDTHALAVPRLPVDGQGHRVLRRLLVLPATLQAAAADAFIASEIEQVDHCVLTHLDECTRIGELFNALIRHRLPVAYWSDSSQVQLPLQKADASVLVATAVAMGKRVPQTDDDEFLITLMQPTRQLVGIATEQPE